MFKLSALQIIFILQLVSCGCQATAACSINSPEHTLALLELYTSEGCNSCPPADRWLSNLSQRGFQTDQVVPLSFHVDYWDYLGWKDRFAMPTFSERQRRVAAWNAGRVIYTPQAVLNGKDYRLWSNENALRQSVRETNKLPARASISLRADKIAANALQINYQASLKDKLDDAKLFVVLYENNLYTEVRAGENKGAKLKHDYVVRYWSGPLALSANEKTTIQLAQDWQPKQLGLAAFVQNQRTGEVLQAVSLTGCT